MATSRARRLDARLFSAAALAGAFLAGCISGQPSGEASERTGETPVPTEPSNPDEPFVPVQPAATCDPTIKIKNHGSALLVRDPEVLAGFQLERVLKQLLLLSGDGSTTPEQLLQRMFDTENTTLGGTFTDVKHCDDPTNGAFKNGPAVDCPRAEGALSKSAGFFTPGDPDYFAPVALVNRFDLTPQGFMTCGEYRIVFAKWSGRSDPEDRVFLIFEGALETPMPGNQEVCRPITKMWASLDDVKDPKIIAQRLEKFYFTGIAGFNPVVHPNHFGLFGSEDDPYGASHGQVRLSQRMEAPLQMREFRVALQPIGNQTRLGLTPVTVKNSPIPELFDSTTTTSQAMGFRGEFLKMQVPALGAKSVARIRMGVSNLYTAGESAIGGPAQSGYWGRVTGGGDSAAFLGEIDGQIQGQLASLVCPPDDPFTARSALDRAAVQTCAGCHAPAQFLGSERKIGCGLVWPSSLGEVHIDEKGTLSPALTEVFMPHRADVMTTYLQACDQDAILANLQPFSGGVIPD